MPDLNAISKKSYDSYDYAYDLNFKNVPEIIVKSIAENRYYSYYYAKHLNFKNVPLIILKSAIHYDYFDRIFRRFPENNRFLCYILKYDERIRRLL